RIVYLDDAADTGSPGNLGLVVARELAAEDGTRLDRRVQHARQLDVDRIDLGAVELVGGVQPLHRPAGDLPVLRVLERDALGIRRRQLGRGGGDLAIGRFPSGARVRDDTVRHANLGDRHLPLVGRRLQKHHARGRTAATNVVVRGAYAPAAARRHLAPDALASEVLARRDRL